MEYPKMKHHNNYVEVFYNAFPNRHHIVWVCGVICQLSFGISQDVLFYTPCIVFCCCYVYMMRSADLSFYMRYAMAMFDMP